jgi:hypothetical protein
VTGAQPNNPGQSGTQYPGQTQLPGQPGPPVNSQNFGGQPAYPIAPGSQGQSPGFPQPGTTTTGQQPNNAAADMIRNILTTPRPGGMPTGNPGMTIGGGIAGVASTAEGEGVKVYNDRTLYSEWEFIFDITKQKQIPNPNGQIGTPAGSMGQPAGNVPGQVGAPGFNGPPMAPGTSPVGAPAGGPGIGIGRQ